RTPATSSRSAYCITAAGPSSARLVLRDLVRWEQTARSDQLPQLGRALRAHGFAQLGHQDPDQLVAELLRRLTLTDRPPDQSRRLGPRIALVDVRELSGPRGRYGGRELNDQGREKGLGPTRAGEGLVGEDVGDLLDVLIDR